MSKLDEVFCDNCKGKGNVPLPLSVSGTITCSVCNGSRYNPAKVFALFLQSPEEFIAGKHDTVLSFARKLNEKADTHWSAHFTHRELFIEHDTFLSILESQYGITPEELNDITKGE